MWWLDAVKKRNISRFCAFCGIEMVRGAVVPPRADQSDNTRGEWQGFAPGNMGATRTIGTDGVKSTNCSPGGDRKFGRHGDLTPRTGSRCYLMFSAFRPDSHPSWGLRTWGLAPYLHLSDVTLADLPQTCPSLARPVRLYPSLRVSPYAPL